MNSGHKDNIRNKTKLNSFDLKFILIYAIIKP